ncbi:hypothetical protein [Cellulomonas pakistanensis]|uniref:Uncharacterized protein n=1 Tax=Cellulomonas pakistanensis TaxID=992287 RepID=A0A919PA09_9CELL|nr:hypothetical protein [Cellulomonas pakistanensis]GIG35853.1 hypothetical protein Cpa01nite_12340 [Cellulomonas pakistanensis]
MTDRRPRVPTAALVVAAVPAWLAAASGRLALALAELGVLPQALGWLVWPRGTSVPVRLVGAVAGLVLVVWLAARLVRRWWVRTPLVALGVLAALTAPMTPDVGTQVLFASMRPQLDAIAELVRDRGVSWSGYDDELPPRLASVSAHGLVAARGDGSVFVPQWAGIPDDAGGFWFTPGTTPEGRDMWGEICTQPVRLDGDWWACAMPEQAGT